MSSHGWNPVLRTLKFRLLASARTVPAKELKVDAANDLALLKAEGKFASLPVSSCRGVNLGGTVAAVGFSDPDLQGFAPKFIE